MLLVMILHSSSFSNVPLEWGHLPRAPKSFEIWEAKRKSWLKIPLLPIPPVNIPSFQSIFPVFSQYNLFLINIPSSQSTFPVASQYFQSIFLVPRNIPSSQSIFPIPSQYSLFPGNIPNSQSIFPVPSQYSQFPVNIPAFQSVFPVLSLLGLSPYPAPGQLSKEYRHLPGNALDVPGILRAKSSLKGSNTFGKSGFSPGYWLQHSQWLPSPLDSSQREPSWDFSLFPPYSDSQLGFIPTAFAQKQEKTWSSSSHFSKARRGLEAPNRIIIH